MTSVSMTNPITEALYTDAEERANRFNLSCLGIIFLCSLVCLALNELGVFTAGKMLMRVSMPCTAVALVPMAIWFIHDRLLKRQPSVCRKSWFRPLIICFMFLTMAIFCVSLSHHAVVLLAVPPLLAAQYRDRRRQNALVLVLTVALVFVSVYGSYFFGMFDRNVHKGMASPEEATYAARVALGTPQRMTELFMHYVLPRMIGLFAAAILAIGIARRNSSMLRKQVELSENIQREMEKRNAMQSHVIDDLAELIESRDVSTGEHVTRTKRYVELIAREMQKHAQYAELLTDETVERIVRAAPLHDIGKIAVSDRILQKPGRLTPEEFELMKEHTVKGGEMVHSILGNLDNETFLQTASEIATSHHERWDGSGYPAGLAGEAIPLPARIMSVADVFDALVSERCYKSAMPPEKAFQIIEEERGRQFDPAIVDLMPALRPAFLEVLGAETKEHVKESEIA